MLFGVPMIPFMIVSGPLVILGTIKPIVFFAIPVSVIMMRLAVAKDELYFDLIAVRWTVYVHTFKCKKDDNSNTIISSTYKN